MQLNFFVNFNRLTTNKQKLNYTYTVVMSSMHIRGEGGGVIGSNQDRSDNLCLENISSSIAILLIINGPLRNNQP